MDIGVNHLDQIIVKSMYKKFKIGEIRLETQINTTPWAHWREGERGGAVSAPKPSSIEKHSFQQGGE